jgi:hypothetical protein
MPVNLKELRTKMEQLAESHEYYIKLTDQERQSMEIAAYNHFRDFGRKMKIAPRLFFDLANRGVNMRYMEPNSAREAWGAKDPKDFARDPRSRGEQGRSR